MLNNYDIKIEYIDILYSIVNMIIPARCFTCGKVIVNRWEMYIRKKMICEGPNLNIYEVEQIHNQNYETPEAKALNDCQIHRICCRRMFLVIQIYIMIFKETPETYYFLSSLYNNDDS